MANHKNIKPMVGFPNVKLKREPTIKQGKNSFAKVSKIGVSLSLKI